MLIGIDAHLLLRDQPTGVPRYTRELLTSMMNIPLKDGERVVLYAHQKQPEWMDLPAGWEWKMVKWPFARGWTHGGLSHEMLMHPPDVLFVPGHELPTGIRKKKTKLVTTVHDVAFCAQPELYPKKEVMRQEFSVRRAVRRADRLIAVSHATADDLQALYGVVPERVRVIHEATRPEQFTRTAVAPGGYILTIGRVERKKNIAMLVEAFHLFKKTTGSSWKLKIVGRFGYGADEVRAAADRSTVSDDIEFLGFVPDRELIPLLFAADVYAFPSKYEGFGIPALEAMAVGIPVIASDIPALRETAGNAALFAPVDNPTKWADQLARLAKEPELRSELIRAGFDRVGEFSWDRAAEETWNLLQGL